MTTFAVPCAPLDRWLEAARDRSSRRSFDGKPLPVDLLDAIERATDRWAPSSVARVAVVREAAAEMFRGVVGGYGRIEGAVAALVMVGSSRDTLAQAAAGYTGEIAVLEATALGVGTCWVGGMFDAEVAGKAVDLAKGETVLAVSPLGTPVEKVTTTERVVYGMGKPKQRKPTPEIAPDMTRKAWPEWARSGAEIARIAPSALNRQPWRFRVEDAGSVIVSFEWPDTPVVFKRLDCGIAMLHFELGARAAGVSGVWEVIEHRTDVARFSLGSA